MPFVEYLAQTRAIKRSFEMKKMILVVCLLSLAVTLLMSTVAVHAQEPVQKLCALRDVNVRGEQWKVVSVLEKGKCVFRLPNSGENGYGQNYWIVTFNGLKGEQHYYISMRAAVQKLDLP